MYSQVPQTFLALAEILDAKTNTIHFCSQHIFSIMLDEYMNLDQSPSMLDLESQIYFVLIMAAIHGEI